MSPPPPPPPGCCGGVGPLPGKGLWGGGGGGFGGGGGGEWPGDEAQLSSKDFSHQF